MANEDLGLRLSAQITDWVANLTKAGNAAEGLRKTVLALEQDIKRAFVGIEAIARQSGGKMVAAFVGAAREMDKATGQIEADAVKAGKSLEGLATTATRAARNVGTSAQSLGKSASAIGVAAGDAGKNTARAMGEVEAAFGAAGNRIRDGIFNIQNALLGLGALRLGQQAVGFASDFEAQIGQVAIVAADAGRPVAQLRQDLLDLSKTTPIELIDLTKALGTAIGTLPKSANQAAIAFDALVASQKAARASGSTAEQVLTGVTAVLNTYGKTGITAEQITDKLFATFDQGGATVPQLTASLGQVVGIASQFGISIDELLGEIAVLTRSGQTAAEAITNLRQALVSAAKPPEIVQKRLKALGVEMGTAALRSKGLVGVLEDIQQAGGGDELEKLFTDIQGFVGVSSLVNAGLGQVRDDIDRIGQSAGKTDQAVEIIGQNFDQLAGIAKNRLGAALLEIGERLLPTLARVLNQFANFAEQNGAAIADGIGKAVDALVSMGTFIASHGDTILAFFVAFKTTRFFAGLAADIGTATGKLRELLKDIGGVKSKGAQFAADGTLIGESLVKGVGGPLKKIGPLISAALRSPGVLGLVVGVGVTLGQALGEAIGDALGEHFEGPIQRQLLDSINDLESRTRGALAGFGVRTMAELDEIRRRIRAGEAVDTGGSGNARDVKTLSEVKAAGGDDRAVAQAFNAGLTSLNTQIRSAQTKVAQETAAMGAAAAKVEELTRLQRGGAELAAAQAQFQALQTSVQVSGLAVGELQQGSIALVKQYADITKQAGVTGRATAGATSAAAKKAKADTDTFLKDLVAEYEAAQNKIRDLRVSAARQTAEGLAIEVDAKRAVLDRETEMQEAALQGAENAEVKLANLRLKQAQAAQDLAEQEIIAVRQASEARILAAQDAAAKEIEAFAGSAEVQAAIQRDLNQTILNEGAAFQARLIEIRTKAAQEVVNAEAEARKASRDELRKQEEINRGGALRAQEDFDAGRISFNQLRGAQQFDEEAGKFALGERGGIAQGLEGVASALQPESILKGVANVGAAGAEAGGLLGGAISGLAGVVTTLATLPAAFLALPDALDGITGILTNGIDDFVSHLFDSILNVLFALVQGLPDQIERLLTETVPAFIEALIGALPEIIGRLIILLPRIVFALAKAIGYSIPLALYEGVVKAGEAMIKFFTTGIVGEFSDAIADIFRPIIKFFEGIGDAVSDAGSAAKTAVTSPFTGTAAPFQSSGSFDTGLLAAFGVRRHQGGMIPPASAPQTAMSMAIAGAQRFTDGGMVNGLNNVARQRMSQILGGDDVPTLMAPGEGVLTAKGVQSVGGPVGVESINRGNAPSGAGAAPAQIMLSARIGGDAALAALISRIVSVSLVSPDGNVRAALDRSSLATRIPGFKGLR